MMGRNDIRWPGTLRVPKHPQENALILQMRLRHTECAYYDQSPNTAGTR